MNIKKLHLIPHLLLLFTVALSGVVVPANEAEAAEFCSDQYYINETLPNGSSWDMCWEHRDREGIIFHHIYYKPKDGTRRMVLNFAAVAQIHVPYDDNGARYHDISDYGIGSDNMLSMNQDECLSGSLLRFENKNVLCQQIHNEGFSYKSGSNADSGNSLSLFSVSPVGAYYYIPRWRFKDDGSIEPAMGATGALQRFGANQSRGWSLSNNQTGIAHLHNFYWKLDFDINNTGDDDIVEEINFEMVNGKRQKSVTPFSNEVSRKVNPETLRHWRVRDGSVKNGNGRALSYDIMINEAGHQDIGPSSEPFTQNDFYVTTYKREEKFGSHNVSGGSNLAEFTNGERLDDVIIWPGTTFYHMPRNEDIPHMDAHWSHIRIIPRDWHDSNPLVTGTLNSPATIVSPSAQNTAQGSQVSLAIVANDSDGDALNYTATGLPTGLQINSSTGVISGTASAAGQFNVTVNVSDGSENSSTQFSWVVESVITNSPPVISSLSARTNTVGQNVNLAVQANDPNGDSLTYSASGLPAGLVINSATGVITGTPTAEGVNAVTVTVSDASLNDTEQFTWTINANTPPSTGFSNEVSNSVITVDGTANDWSGLDYFANDPDDTAGENNQIDWLRASIAHSPQNVFITYQNRQNIEPNSASGTFVSWGWTVYLDTDNNAATGYQSSGGIGTDYMISGRTIERYTGTGTDWSWEIVESANLSYSGSNLEMTFPRALIGNPTDMRVVFVGNNSAFGGTGRDLYPDTGSFEYQFTGTSNTNIAPVAKDQQVSVGSGASVSIVLSATDSNNDSLNYQVVGQPQNGTITGSAPNIVYKANDNFVGTDVLSFKANDGTVDSQIANVTMIVTSSQNAGAFSNYVNTPITVDGLDADWSGLDRFDPDPDDATGNIDWRDAAFAHNAQMLYLNYKNIGNIDPDSDAGSYLAWGWQVFIDTDKQVSTGFKVGGLGADYVIEGRYLQKYTGTGSNWSWVSATEASTSYNGAIAELSLPRSQLGNPDSIRVIFKGNSSAYGGTGVDLYPNTQNDPTAERQYFDYEFSGGSTGGNDRPIASTQNLSVNVNEQVNIVLTGSDPDNDVLNYNILTNPSNGSLSGTAPNLTYAPENGFTGQDSFTFNVNDGNTVSETASVNINVTNIQNGVYSNLVSSLTIDGNESDWSTLSSFTDDANDVSGENNVIDWQNVTAAHSSSDMFFMFRNFGDVNPQNSSGDYLSWGWQTYIDIDSDASTGFQVGNIGAEYIIEGTNLQTYTGTGSDWSWGSYTSVDLKYSNNIVEFSFARSLINNPSEFKVLFVGNNGASGGSGSDNYPNNLNGFTYVLNGGAVSVANRPVAMAATFEVTESMNSDFNLSASDQDNDTLTYRVVSQPANGVLSGLSAESSAFSYLPNSGFTGQDSFRYVVNDGTFDSSVRTVTLNVSPEQTSVDNGGNSSGGGSLGLLAIILLTMIGLLKNYRRSFLAVLSRTGGNSSEYSID